MYPYVEMIRKRRREKNATILSAMDILPALDTSRKVELLQLCVPQLREKEILARWLAIMANESDDEIKAYMLTCLPSIVENTKALTRHYFKALMNCMDLGPQHRQRIAYYLDDLIFIEADLYQWFMVSYAKEKDKYVRAALVWPLLRIKTVEKDLAAFFKSILNQVDENLKYHLLLKLLSKDLLSPDELLPHLQATEPASIKRLVLNYLEDRALCPAEALKKVYANEWDPGIKQQLMRLLLKSPLALEKSLVDFFLTNLHQETDADMRNLILRDCMHSITVDLNNIEFLCRLLTSEKSTANAKLMVDWLAPYYTEFEQIKYCFLNLLEKAVDVSLAVMIVECLGIHLSKDMDLVDRMFSKYASVAHDLIREEILVSFANCPIQDKRLYALYASALNSVSPGIKTQGLRGLLLIPMTDAVFDLLEGAAPILLDASIDPELRIALAQKIAILPKKSSGCKTRLKEVMVQTSEAGLQKIVADVFEKMKQENEIASNVDWEWFERQVKLEKNIDHIFPDIYLYFEENVEKARELLRLMLMDDSFRAELYSKDIDRKTMLDFLIAKDQIDSELTKFALNKLIEKNEHHSLHDGGAEYMLVLKNSRDLTGIKDRLWVFFEREIVLALEGASDVDLTDVRDIFIRACGEHQLFLELTKRLAAAPDLKAVKPYLVFVIKASPWIYSSSLIDFIVNKKHELFWALEIVRKQDKDAFCADFLSFAKQYGRQLFSLEEAVVLRKEKKGFADD